MTGDLSSIKIGLGRRSLQMNMIAFSLLFVGYLLTAGTEFIGSEIAKSTFRVLALSVFVINVILDRSIRRRYVISLYLFSFVLLLNQSGIAGNCIFLLVVSASLSRLSGKEIAIALVVPAALFVFLHVLMLNAGLIAGQTTEFGERTRSTLGFKNANQAAATYLSFAILSIFTYFEFRNRFSQILVAGSLISAFLVVQYTDSRTTMFTLALLTGFLASGYLLSGFRLYRQWITLFAVISPFFAVALTYYLTTSASPTLNELLSLRPYFFSRFMSEISPLQWITGWQTTTTGGVDNAFLMLLSGTGAFGFAAILAALGYLISQVHSKFAPLIIVLMAASVFESFLLRPEISVSALFLHLLLSRSTQRATKNGVETA